MAQQVCHDEYTFDELGPDAQETALEQYAVWSYDGIEADMLEDADYWQERFMDPAGATWSTRSVPLMNGSRRQEPEVYWNTYPHEVWFQASIDLETFIRTNTLGRKYALLLSAVRSGEVHSASVGTTSDRGYSRDWRAEIGTSYEYGYWSPAQERRYAKLDIQVAAMEDELDDWYQDTTHDIASSIRRQEEYLTSTEYARESLVGSAYPVFDAEGHMR